MRNFSMKIAINNVCNLNCPYCFAGNMGISHRENISVDDFRAICEWLALPKNVASVRDLSIIGGEPTIHPDFASILKIVSEYHRSQNWHGTLFTNGIELANFLEFVPPTMDILLNYNDPESMPCAYAQKIANLFDITKQRSYRFGMNEFPYHIGCNLHHMSDNYDFFWCMVEKYEIHKVRVSVTVPTGTEYIKHRDEYYTKMKPILMEFLRKAWEHQVIVQPDCSMIPYCYFTGEEIFFMLHVFNNHGLDLLGSCDACLETIRPNLTVAGCFGAQETLTNIRYDAFENVNEIQNTLSRMRAHSIRKRHIQKCSQCYAEKQYCMGGCFGFDD